VSYGTHDVPSRPCVYAASLSRTSLVARLRRTIGNDRASSSACVGALPCGHPRPVHIRFEITVTMTGSDVPGVWLLVRGRRSSAGPVLGFTVRSRDPGSAICDTFERKSDYMVQTRKESVCCNSLAVNQINVVYWVCRNHGYTSSGCRMWYLLARDGPQAPQPFRRVARRSRARKVVQRTTLIMPVEVLMIYKNVVAGADSVGRDSDSGLSKNHKSAHNPLCAATSATSRGAP